MDNSLWHWIHLLFYSLKPPEELVIYFGSLCKTLLPILWTPWLSVWPNLQSFYLGCFWTWRTALCRQLTDSRIHSFVLWSNYRLTHCALGRLSYASWIPCFLFDSLSCFWISYLFNDIWYWVFLSFVERDELRKDIEQLCIQQAGPSYLVVATRMHFQRYFLPLHEDNSLSLSLSHTHTHRWRRQEGVFIFLD